MTSLLFELQTSADSSYNGRFFKGIDGALVIHLGGEIFAGDKMRLFLFIQRAVPGGKTATRN